MSMQAKKSPSQELSTPSRNTPLYQQLYVPTLGGPNPNLLNLDKIMKKYSKASKLLTSLNLCIGFLLTLAIAEKVYYLSEYFVHVCRVFEQFVLVTLAGNIVWLIASFMVVFANKKKAKNIIKVYLGMMMGCFAMMGSSLVVWKVNREGCDLKGSDMTISFVVIGVEMGAVFVMFWAEVYMLKLIRVIETLRDSYLNDNLAELK